MTARAKSLLVVLALALAACAPDPPAAPHAPHMSAPCDAVLQQGCTSPTSACDVDLDSDPGWTVCRSVTGTASVAQHCPSDTDCKAGLTCIQDEVPAHAPRCWRLCARDRDCVEPGSRCDAVLPHAPPDGHGSLLGICTLSFSPTGCTLAPAAGCPSGLGCIAVGGHASCADVGTRPAGATCTTTLACAPGLGCTIDPDTKRDRCEPYCVMDAPGACASPQACTASVPPIVIDGVAYGNCH